MSLRPLYDYVLVKQLESEHETLSGILIPDTAAEKPNQGEVIATGKGKILEDGNRHQLEIKAGDKVLFGKHAGQIVKVDGKEMFVMREKDILAVIEA
mgnify:FL=1